MIAEQSLTTEKFQSERVSTIALGHAIHDTYTAFLPSFLPLLIERYALSKTEASLLPFLTQAPSILQPFIGYLGDRVGLRLLLFLGPAVTAIMMSLVGAAPTYSLAVVFLLIVGLSSAGFHAIGPAIAGRLSAARLGLGMSLWMAAGELGRTLGPLIAVAAIQGLGQQRLPWLMVIGILVSLAIYWNLRDVPAQPQRTPDPLPWHKAWHLLRPVLLPVSALLITRALAQVAFSTFLPTFLTEEGASLWLAGGSLTIMEFAGIGGAFLGGSLSDRLGRKSVLIVAGIGAAIFTVVFLATTGLALRLITLLGLGATMLSVTPILMALIQDHYPEQRALANGAFMAVNFVIGSLAMLGVGWLGDHFGLHTTYWLSTGFMILGLPIILALPENHHPRSRL